jgi:hypothetical protein
MVEPTAGSDFPDQAFGAGFIAGPYPAGRYAELKISLAVATARP